jgi:signal transduction histidine kinase
MRTFDTPYIADWYVVSLRWLTLLGMIISLALGGMLAGTPLWPLIALMLWNIAMTVIAGLNARMIHHRQISMVVDLLASGVFFWLQGGMLGPVAWAGLLPILTGALYFELRGGLIFAFLFSIVEVASIWTGDLRPAYLQLISIVVAVTFSVGILFGFLSKLLIRSLRNKRITREDEEEHRRGMERERMRALYDMTATLTGTLSYERVLDAALDLGYAALNPDTDAEADEKLVSAVMLFRGDLLTIGSARRFTPADIRVQLPGEAGLLKNVVDEGKAMLTDSVSYDPELGRIIALRTCTSAYCFPLLSGLNVYGAMLFAHADPNYFDRERRALLDMIGRQAVIAIQNARLYQDILQEKDRMMEVHEEARKKLARDLHDGPTQSVAAMAMRINIARRMFEKDEDKASEELVKIEQLAHRTTKEIRHMLFTLRPLILESQGLSAALVSMAEKMRETYSQNVVIDVNDKLVENLEMGLQGALFYIVEEAVNNARKHAAAAMITVGLKQLEPGLLILEIQDNGVGFNVEEMNISYNKRSSSSLGMINLRERTALVNGVLNVHSELGKGTLVQVFFPLTDEAADRLLHAKQ